MKKYQIIIVLAAGVLSFSASFGTNWFMKQKTASAAVLPMEQSSATAAAQSGEMNRTSPYPFVEGNMTGLETEQPGVSERQLQHLIFDLREKMRDYSMREKELDEEAKRLEVTRLSLQEDIEQLNSLREKLDLSLAAMKEKEENIQKSLIEVESVERANFQRLAATYEKMDAAQAGKIMVSMAANNQLQDVVKILYYMNDRNAGKVLGEIGSTRAEVAGVLSLQLKRVREGQ